MSYKIVTIKHILKNIDNYKQCRVCNRINTKKQKPCLECGGKGFNAGCNMFLISVEIAIARDGEDILKLTREVEER